MTVTDLGAPTRSSSQPAKGAPKPGLIARIRLFIKQVLDELRKVVRPTRAELINYTLVVIVFVSIMMLLTGVLDFSFTKLVDWVYGG
ncbi:preprotein translocase subunit SecE [Nostocoides veronense]|uniref:Protein translocase subunit SecE n=1 Tax=Nostocoides veronense TaxID=330836 RepID=A0ABP4XGB0_9MICO